MPTNQAPPLRVGIGYDVHRLVSDRPLILGGVTIPYDRGLAGHSDADVLVHAICDALLGAAVLGDLGAHFSDASDTWEGADSLDLLARVMDLVGGEGYRVGNVDATVVVEEPKLAPHIPSMRKNIARAVDGVAAMVSVKATTSEGLGFVGSRKGIAAHAVCTVIKED